MKKNDSKVNHSKHYSKFEQKRLHDNKNARKDDIQKKETNKEGTKANKIQLERQREEVRLKRKGLDELYAKAHYLHYFQFDSKITPQLFMLLANRPLALKVLAIIMFCAWPSRWGAVIIKQKDLRRAVAKSPGKSANRTSVARAIRYLRALGILAVSKYDVRDAFIINPRFIWQKPPTETYLKRSVLNSPHIRFDADPRGVRDIPSIKYTFTRLHKPISIPLYSSDFKYLTLGRIKRKVRVIRRDQKGNPIKDSNGKPEEITITRYPFSYYNNKSQRTYIAEDKRKRKARHEYYIKHRK